jgi:hypothetical protein
MTPNTKKMRRLAVILAGALFPLALVAALSANAQPASPVYDAYHSALKQLRTARAYIEHPDSGELHDQEKTALANIDMAIAELRSVADDGRGPEDHDPLDSHMRWIARLNKAADILNKAHDNVQKENDSSPAKDRAIQDIGQARKYIEQAIALEQ